MSPFKYAVPQYGYVVDDIEEAAMHWFNLVGAGPFIHSPHHVSPDHFYRGQPSEADLSYAFGQAGPAHIQLIQQHNDAPSVYREMFPVGQSGLHHVAILPPDWEGEKKRYEDAGYETVTTLVSASRVAYMDTRPAIGCFVELYEDNERLRETFASWKKLHEEWDGVTDPIRVIANLDD